MAFTMTLWGVHDEKLTPVPKHRLDSEDRLETWIAQDPSLLGMDVLIIGRQVTTSFGMRIDLLAIDDEGNLVIIELKRDLTSRETVAQVLDYASWVNALTPEAINDIASDYLKRPLANSFKERFGTTIPDDINTSHRLLIVASDLDDSSERIVQYLSTVCCLDINVVFFTCFQHNGVELLGRSWLMDPVGEARGKRWTNWKEALSDVANSAVVDYFNERIDEEKNRDSNLRNWDSNLAKRRLGFLQDGKRRWGVNVRKNNACVYQLGRFDGDIRFWQGELSRPNDVASRKHEASLKFYLSSEKDFAFFHEAVTGSLRSKVWSTGAAANDDDVDEREDG